MNRATALLLVCAALLAPTSAALRPTTTSRRAILVSAASYAAVVQRPSASEARIGDGCTECTNKELETSPLIEELKRRTEANKEKNAAIIKETTDFTGAVAEEKVRMVRYAGAGDSMPVTRMMTDVDIKKLESMGFVVECPSWGGACSVRQVTSRTVDPPPSAPPPPSVDAEEPAAGVLANE